MFKWNGYPPNRDESGWHMLSAPLEHVDTGEVIWVEIPHYWQATSQQWELQAPDGLWTCSDPDEIAALAKDSQYLGKITVTPLTSH